MSKTKGLLAAATFTGLVLVTILALGFGPLSGSQAKSSGDTSVDPAGESALPTNNNMSNEEAIQAWQEYSAQLEQTVRSLQERDTAYQQQLDEANGTILQLQGQINSSSSPTYYDEREEDKEFEERGEYEEHEREEYEAFEYGEFDD